MPLAGQKAGVKNFWVKNLGKYDDFTSVFLALETKMNSTNKSPQIRDSEFKGYSVLVVDPDEQRGMEYEANAELDQNLQRINVFVVPSMREARDFIKSRRPNVVIFPGELDGFDFVTLQLEFKNANPTTGMVPLVENPTLQQYRESRRIGGVIDFAAPTTLESFENLRDLILQACRSLATEQPGFEEGLNYSLGLQRALLISHPGLTAMKSESAVICREVTAWYDLSCDEVVTLILAEKLYLPDLTTDKYQTLLGSDPYGLLGVLTQTASWTQAGTKPTSTSGLIVTTSNCIAQWRQEQVPMQEIADRIKSRPQFMMHVSLRVMSQDKVLTLLSQLDGILAESAMG